MATTVEATAAGETTKEAGAATAETPEAAVAATVETPEAAVVATAETPEAAVATTTGTAGRDAETMMGKESASKSRSLSRSVLLGTAGSRGTIGLWTQHHQCTSPMMPRS